MFRRPGCLRGDPRHRLAPGRGDGPSHPAENEPPARFHLGQASGQAPAGLTTGLVRPWLSHFDGPIEARKVTMTWQSDLHNRGRREAAESAGGLSVKLMPAAIAIALVAAAC